METRKYIAYYRVSTREQEKSGLGLEAQRQTVEKTVSEKGGQLIGEFIEVESGKKDDRPQLEAALDLCSLKDATLIIAKLDRLSRSVSFIFKLRDAGVDFFACDLPACNTMNLAIFAAIAQHEREIISERTKAALLAKKERGEKLGNPQNMTNEARRKGNKSHQRKALERHKKVYFVARLLKGAGATYEEIARALNKQGFRTSKGKEYNLHRVVYLFRYHKNLKRLD